MSILLVPVNSVYSGIDVRTLAADVANTGSYSWTIPNCTADNPCSSNFEIPTGSYYIRVVDPSNVGDDSTAPVSIVAATPSLTVLSPNGGETWQTGSMQTIRWNASGFPYVLVDLDRYDAPSGLSYFVKRIANGNAASDQQLSWQVSSDIPAGSSYKIFISGTNTPGVYGNTKEDYSDAPFSIVSATQPSIPVISLDPSTPSSQNVTVGSANVDMTHIKFSAVDRPITITELWVGGNGFANDVSYIGLYDGGTLLQRQVVYGSSGSGQAIMVRFYDNNGLLAIPAYSSKTIYIKADISQNAQAGHSLALGITSGRTADSQFTTSVMGNAMTIVSSAQPSVSVLSPTSGTTWEAGKTYNISWMAANAPGDAWVGVVRLYKGGGQFLIDIVPSFSWNPPTATIQYTVSNNSVTGNDFRIHVVLNKGPVGSESNIAEAWSAPFSIVAAGGVGQSASLTQLANTLESMKALLEELSRLVR